MEKKPEKNPARKPSLLRNAGGFVPRVGVKRLVKWGEGIEIYVRRYNIGDFMALSKVVKDGVDGSGEALARSLYEDEACTVPLLASAQEAYELDSRLFALLTEAFQEVNGGDSEAKKD